MLTGLFPVSAQRHVYNPDPPAQGGTAHTGLDPPPSVNNQGNTPQTDMPVGQSDGGHSSTASPPLLPGVSSLCQVESLLLIFTVPPVPGGGWGIDKMAS